MDPPDPQHCFFQLYLKGIKLFFAECRKLPMGLSQAKRKKSTKMTDCMQRYPNTFKQLAKELRAIAKAYKFTS
jgi:hypothetical protein